MCGCIYADCVLACMYRYMHVWSYFRWLKQEYEIPFPLDKQPPVHMPIAYGLVDIQKMMIPEKARPRSQVQAASLGMNIHGTDVANKGLQGNNSRGETSEQRQCSLCNSNSEVIKNYFRANCYVVDYDAGG